MGIAIRAARLRALAAAAACACALAAAPADADAGLRAEVRTTAYDVPHIKARDFRSLGYGVGYTMAEDNICTMADSYVTVAGERSRYFGPDASWTFRGNGFTFNNLDSDFFYERINRSGLVEELAAAAPPHGPLPKVREVVAGFVRGYNAYLADTGVANIPDERCRGADWVRPITKLDAYRRFHQLGSLASAGTSIGSIGSAAPLLDPGATAAAERRQRSAFEGLATGETEVDLPLELGSNAYGLGAEATRNGRGMVLGNPHFPWDGSERLYQMHLTIPGRLDVSGAGLLGVPLVLIGHTDGLAWSHTVATAWRFTPYELTINPLDPHQYLLDGRFVDMEATELTVKARTEEGGLEERTRTLYGTEFGPMFTSLVGLPFPWTPAQGFALGDVNERNFRYLNHFLRTDLAQSIEEYDAIQARFQGIPWVNSIAADRDGRAYYSMGGAIPNVDDAKAASCAGAVGLATFTAVGLPVLDGSRSQCAWDSDPRATAPGLLPHEEIPVLERSDYVLNGNDSHWLTNPAEPLTGFERIVGVEGAELSFRTRSGHVIARERLDGSDGLAAPGFNLRLLTEVALGNRQHLGELWRDELVAMCEANPSINGVDVSGACPVLAAWEVRDDLDSSGAILFRRFASNLLSNFTFVPSGTQGGTLVGSSLIWDRQFDPDDPVDTPSGLQTDNPLVRQALADAVTDLGSAGIPLDAPLRGYQYETRGGERIPIHGGPGGLGVFNAISAGWSPPEGFPNIPHGSSFIMAAKFRGRGCPARSHTFVTYGQTEDQGSPHASDYTRAFSRKSWNRVPYCEPEIRGDPALEVRILRD